MSPAADSAPRRDGRNPLDRLTSPPPPGRL